MTDELAQFRQGMDKCPACGAPLTYTESADGSAVDMTHPYDPATGPPCAAFVEFCSRLLERGHARGFDVVSRSPNLPCAHGEHVCDNDHPDFCVRCGAELGPLWGYPSVTRKPRARGKR